MHQAELICIQNALLNARYYGFENEVVLSALKHMSIFPHASISEAIQVGLDEWDVDDVCGVEESNIEFKIN